MNETEESCYFQYGETEITWLKKRDDALAAVIDQIGPVRRQVIPDLFEALIHTIVGQQISAKAHATIWRRLKERLGDVTPHTVAALDERDIQACGMTMKKAGCIRQAALKIQDGGLDLAALAEKSDDEVRRALSALNGVGVWTAEMLMTFSLQRPDIMSFGDLAIHRGLRMVYRHRKINHKLFDKYRRRYSPYATVACLYLWAVAGGAIEGLRDCAPQGKGASKRGIVEK